MTVHVIKCFVDLYTLDCKAHYKVYYLNFHRNNFETWGKKYVCHGGLEVLNEETFLFCNNLFYFAYALFFHLII